MLDRSIQRQSPRIEEQPAFRVLLRGWLALRPFVQEVRLLSRDLEMLLDVLDALCYFIQIRSHSSSAFLRSLNFNAQSLPCDQLVQVVFILRCLLSLPLSTRLCRCCAFLT